LKGLRGTLSSKGQFDGPLDYLTVEGETDAPDFGLRTMGHPVALHTDFSALVDGTNGDVILNSVTAKFLHTVLTVGGEIVDVSKDIKGRTILLNAVSNDARVEDLLRLAVNSDEAVMTGSLRVAITNVEPTGGKKNAVVKGAATAATVGVAPGASLAVPRLSDPRCPDGTWALGLNSLRSRSRGPLHFWSRNGRFGRIAVDFGG
jgi:hypothetical protein